jgi:ech hydrogenase subunit C
MPEPKVVVAVGVCACTGGVFKDTYNIKGGVNTGDPMQADIFLITGGVNEQNIPVVKQLYEQMPEPKVVVAVGVCACTGGVFKDCYNIIGGADQAIPVDIYVPGCAARPQAIIDGIVKAIGLFQERLEKSEKESDKVG